MFTAQKSSCRRFLDHARSNPNTDLPEPNTTRNQTGSIQASGICASKKTKRAPIGIATRRLMGVPQAATSPIPLGKERFGELSAPSAEISQPRTWSHQRVAEALCACTLPLPPNPERSHSYRSLAADSPTEKEVAAVGAAARPKANGCASRKAYRPDQNLVLEDRINETSRTGETSFLLKVDRSGRYGSFQPIKSRESST